MVVQAGRRVNAADIAAIRPRRIRKAASQDFTSTTVANDADIVVTLEAGKTFWCRLNLAASNSSGSGGGDIKLTWTVTGGVTQDTSRSCIGPAIATTDVTDGNARISRHNLTTEVGYGLTASSTTIQEEFFVETVTAGTSGTLRLRAAQNSGPTGTTTVSTATSLVVQEVDDL